MSYAALRSMCLLLLLFFAPAITFAQSPVSLLYTGGSNNDEGRIIRLAPNGNIVLAGYFYDTVDLDPGPSEFNLISVAHTRDIFIASYTQTGKLVWAFSIGGPGADGVFDMAITPNNDIYIVGYFKDSIDFDPSSGQTIHRCSGYIGINTDEYGGDGFLAKYSPGGAFHWVVPLQSSYGEEVEAVGLDPQGNVYIGGQYRNIVDFDPSPTAVEIHNSVNDGTGFLAKYTSAGQFVWVNTFGKPGITMTDNVIRGVAVDAFSNIYMTGFFQGVNNDFDPSGNVAPLSAVGLYDVVVAKYDRDGNYIWALNIQSEAIDDAFDIKLDGSGYLYVAGSTYGSTVDFDPLSPAGNYTFPNTSGIPNIFLAKYDVNGNYQWSKLMGSAGTDMGLAMHISGGNIYNIGFFSGPMDLNPNAAPPVNINSKGEMDLYLVKYDSAGNYKCHLTIGSSSNDVGRDAFISPAGDLFITGSYSNDADFDLSSLHEQKIPAKGKRDLLLAKYVWDCAKEGLPLKDTTVLVCDTPFIFEGVSMSETGIYGVLRRDSMIVVHFETTSPLLKGAFIHSTPVMNEPVEFTNESIGALAFTWDFGDSTGSADRDPSHMYLKSGVYNVCLTVYNEVCTAKICHIVDAIAEPAVGVPTGFSPNGDGKNDILYVRGGAVEKIHLVIYNRWGQKVFETKDIKQGWDGTYQGQQQGLDAVGYVLNATMLDGRQVHQSGNVTIIR